MALLSSISGLATLPVLGGLVCLYFVINRLVLFVKLRKFGGPWWTGITHWPHSKHILGHDAHEWYAEVNEKHGPIARIAPGILMTSSPEVWTHVNRHPGYKRTDWFYHAARVEHRRDNVFTQTDNAKHDKRRKQMAPGYSGRENLDLEPAVDARVAELIALLRRNHLSTPARIVPVDLAKKIQYLTLDVISGVGLGKTFGMLRHDADVDAYLASNDQGLTAANAALALGGSWLAQAPLVGRLLAPSPAADGTGFGKMMAACFRAVDARAAGETDKRSDMLASFIRHGLRGDELRSEALEQIIAGSDTTAAAIRGTLLAIMTNARVYALLRREIDEAVRDGLAPGAGGGVVSLEQTRKMPYLQAVIREAVRVRPPVVCPFPRDVPAGGDTISVGGESVFVPEGVCIGYSANAMHRSEETYGADAKAFRPERWFEEDEAKLAVMRSVNDMVFGYGRFMCLGKPVAQLEMAKTVFELLRNFDLALIDPARPWKAHNVMGLFVISNMWVQVMERTA